MGAVGEPALRFPLDARAPQGFTPSKANDAKQKQKTKNEKGTFLKSFDRVSIRY